MGTAVLLRVNPIHITLLCHKNSPEHQMNVKKKNLQRPAVLGNDLLYLIYF